MRFSTLMHRLPATPMASALLLAASITTAGAQPINGVYTVDDVTNTGPQVFATIDLGFNADGTLNVFDGRLVGSTGHMEVGFTNGPQSVTAIINVMGNQSRLEVGGHIRLASNANQPFRTVATFLNVGAGGHVRCDMLLLTLSLRPAQSTVTVSGPGSLLETVTTLEMRHMGTQIAIVRIEPGGTVSVGTVIVLDGTPQIILDGGTLSLTDPSALPPPGIIQFNSGSLRFRSSQTLAAGTGFLTDFYGSPPVLGTGRGLTIDGTTTLATSLTLDGGSLSTTRIAVNPSTGSILLNGGTLTLTGDGAVIDDGGDFGPDPLTVGDGTGAAALLELGSAGDLFLGAVTVAADGALNFGGESLIVDSLHNDGSISIADATLDVRDGLHNGGSLSLADAVVEGDVTSPAGATIDVAGTVVFNGNFAGTAAFYGSGTVIFNGTLSID